MQKTYIPNETPLKFKPSQGVTRTKRRFCLFFLLVGVFLGVAQGNEFRKNHEGMYELGKKLERLGYDQSAKHYFKLLIEDPKLSPELRAKVEKSMGSIRTQPKQKALMPSPDIFLHFDQPKVAKTTFEKSSQLAKDEYSNTRLNKKKWWIGTAITIGVLAVAHRVWKVNNRTQRKVNSIRIEF